MRRSEGLREMGLGVDVCRTVAFGAFGTDVLGGGYWSKPRAQRVGEGARVAKQSLEVRVVEV